jgi:hypothetical protein
MVPKSRYADGAEAERLPPWTLGFGLFYTHSPGFSQLERGRLTLPFSGWAAVYR